MPCLTEELEVTVTKVFDARWLILIHFSCSEDKIEMTSYRFMYQNVPHLPRSPQGLVQVHCVNDQDCFVF